MERAKNNIIRTVAWVGALTLILPVFPLGVEAGTILLPSVAHEEDNQYPESRFGQPPARVSASSEAKAEDEGTVSRFAGTEDMSDSLSIRRSVASLTTDKRQGAAKGKDVVSDLEIQAATRRHGVQEVALIAGDLGYFPKTFFVSRDIPVRLFVTGASKSTLCIMMDSFQVRKQVRSQKIEEITFTPNHPGKYRFYCPVNGMEGTMIVKEFASVAATEN